MRGLTGLRSPSFERKPNALAHRLYSSRLRIRTRSRAQFHSLFLPQVLLRRRVRLLHTGLACWGRGPSFIPPSFSSRGWRGLSVLLPHLLHSSSVSLHFGRQYAKSMMAQSAINTKAAPTRESLSR